MTDQVDEIATGQMQWTVVENPRVDPGIAWQLVDREQAIAGIFGVPDRVLLKEMALKSMYVAIMQDVDMVMRMISANTADDGRMITEGVRIVIDIPDVITRRPTTTIQNVRNQAYGWCTPSRDAWTRRP